MNFLVLPFKIVSYSGLFAENNGIEALLKRVYVDEGYADAHIAQKIFIFSEVAKRGDIILLESENSEIVGMVICADSSNPSRQVARKNEAEMQLLAVDNHLRNKGLGRALCLAFEERAKARGFHNFVLSTQTTMKSTHLLYEKLGYIRNASRDWQKNNRQFLVYEKNLAN